jgi:signal transduction histidine kinase
MLQVKYGQADYSIRLGRLKVAGLKVTCLLRARFNQRVYNFPKFLTCAWPEKSAMIPYTIPLLIAAAISILLAVYAWQQRRVLGTRAFTLLLLAIGQWALGYAFELNAPTLEGKLFWTSFNFIGIVTIPPSLLVFVLRYTRFDRWLTRRNVILLSLPAAVTLALAWTNQWHGLIRSSASLNTSGPIVMFAPVYNVGFWAFWGYDILLALVCLVATVWAWMAAQGVVRSQLGILFASLLIPWIGNVIYLSGLSPFYGLDLTPLSFTLASMLLAWGIVRYRMLDVLPVAMEMVFAGIDDGAIVLDVNGRITDLNPAAQRIFDLDRRVIGQAAAQVLEDYPALVSQLGLRQAARGEYPLGATDCRDYDTRFLPLTDPLGRFGGLLFLLHDVTERRRVEDELKRAKEAAEQANRAKTTFLANMSHELRTPLNAILGYSEMLAEEVQADGKPSYVRDLQNIQTSGQHLLMLINDILDLTRVEAGRMPLHLETFDLAALVDELAAVVQPLFEKNRNLLHVQIEPGLANMHADKVKVRQILFNLLSNATKFTHQGQIDLTVTCPSNGPSIVLFEVRDTGIGMTPEQLQLLFRPFSQVDPSPTRRFGGSGLGLALTQSFCQMMGGSIHVVSTPSVGSTFTVQLPLEVRVG